MPRRVFCAPALPLSRRKKKKSYFVLKVLRKGRGREKTRRGEPNHTASVAGDPEKKRGENSIPLRPLRGGGEGKGRGGETPGMPWRRQKSCFVHRKRGQELREKKRGKKGERNGGRGSSPPRA